MKTRQGQPLASALVVLVAALGAGCATTGDSAAPDMTSASPDMACTDNIPPTECLPGEPQSEKELLNRCSEGVVPLVRDSRVPAELWDGRCALPPL